MAVNRNQNAVHIFQGGTEAPTGFQAVVQPSFTKATWVADVERHLRNLHKCGLWHKCLHADLWDGYHVDEFLAYLATLYIPGAGTVTDNAVPRWNGTTGLLLQNSAVIIADTTNNISGLGSISLAAAPGATSPNIFAPGSSTYGIAVGATYVSLVTDGVARITVAADGKVTIPGLLDPTGLEMTPVGANPGGTAANTLWADSGAGNRFKVGTNTLAYLSEVGTGDVTAASNMTDHTLVRGDGGAKGVQDSGVTLDDSDNITGVAALGATTVELGHASDTTLARVSAGNVSVEGNLMYRAGGTDVPVADGGTGASTEDAALENLIGGATGVTPTELHNVGLHDGFSTNHGKASIGGILTMDPSALSLGGTPIVGQIPRWHKIAVPYNATGFVVAAKSASITLFSLPSGGMIHAVVIKASTAWDLARVALSVGISGTTDKYAAVFRQDTAVTNTNFQLSTVQGIEAIGAATNILVTAEDILGASNLNALGAGSSDIYVLLSGLL